VDFLAQVFTGLLHALEQLAVAFERPGEFNRLMRRLGWATSVDDASLVTLAATFSSATSPFQNLENIVSQLEDGTGDPVELAGQLLAGLSQVLGEIRGLIENPPPALPPPLGDPSFWNDSAVELVDTLFSDCLAVRRPLLQALLLLIGFIDITPVTPAGPNRIPYQQTTVHWDRLTQLASDPEGLVRSVYGWGGPAFDVARFLNVTWRIMRATRLAARIEPLDPVLAARYYDPGNPALPSLGQLAIPLVSHANADWSGYIEFGVLLFPIPPKGQPGAAPVGFAITPLASGAAVADMPPGDSPFTLAISGSFQASDVFAAEIRPGDVDLTVNTGPAQIDASLAVAGQPATPWILFGDPGGTRLEVSGLAVGVEVKGTAGGVEVIASGGAVGSATDNAADGTDGATLYLDFGSGDGFLQQMLGSGTQQVSLSGSFNWSSQAGLSLSGQAKVQAVIPLHVTIAGVLDLDQLDIGLTVSGSAAALVVAISGGLTLGPVQATVQRVGIELDLEPVPASGPPGNLDKLNLGFGFKPPDGLGLQLDMGLVSGGGFIAFDPGKGQYAGILDVMIADVVAVKVIGVLDTKLPDGSDGFALLLIITFDLPPIQLGFGFTLNGVGGLGGVNRTMAQDALRAGLRAHTLDAILFPPDPVANAPQIISDIESFFPPQQGRYLFGPMLSVGWGTPTLIDFEVGVILEVPDPVRIAILGEINVTIPDPDVPLIQIHVDVLGLIDFGLEKLSIDGTMFDSYLLAYQLAGDMALRFNWGGSPNFLFSLGGFNPKFSPPPDVPQLARMSVSLGSGDNPRLSSNSYLAVTSNSLQFGANVDAYASAGGFAVHGFIGYDALFIFSPFSFEIDFSAGFDISYDATSLAGITLNASLSGPRPWHLHGDASFNILFFSVSASIDLTWGDAVPATLPSAPVLPPLAAALGNPGNWSVALPPQASQPVTLRTSQPPAQTLLAHPMGALTARETVVPLDIPITQFNGAAPADGNEFQITAVTLNGHAVDYTAHTEEFAIAQYTTMSDADKLSAPSYEPFDAGVAIGAQPIAGGHDSPRTVTYQERYIDDYAQQSRFGSIYTMPATVHDALAGNGAGARSPVAAGGLQRFTTPGMSSPIAVNPASYAIASTTDLTARADILAAGTTRYEAMSVMQAYLAAHPEQQGALQVVPAHEVAP
jgi:hypothetical protein